ncbi:MAG: FliM/FliN family flagellar motor switch protein [Phycisphaerales bacterium]|nr:MAG: FliM/FliN family flagellar motor switch protein [Phycisphaerales bacterium]
MISQADIDALLASAGDLAQAIEDGGSSDGVATGPPEPSPTSPPGAPDMEQPATVEHPPEVARIMRMKVPVIVTLVERDLTLSGILAWTAGSIIEFDTPSNSELHLVIANKEIGRGHAVKVGENFGLRINRINNLTDRIHAMGGG